MWLERRRSCWCPRRREMEGGKGDTEGETEGRGKIGTNDGMGRLERDAKREEEERQYLKRGERERREERNKGETGKEDGMQREMEGTNRGRKGEKMTVKEDGTRRKKRKRGKIRNRDETWRKKRNVKEIL